MMNFALLFSLLLTSIFGIMIISNFAEFNFYWSDLVVYTVVGLIVYVIIMVVGSKLDKKFNDSIQTFLDGKKENLFDDKKLLRTFGLLLIALLPFLFYLQALALFAAIDFAGYSYFSMANSGQIYIGIAIGLVIVVIGTGIAILIGFYFMFFPPKRKTTGIIMNEREQQHLWAVSNEIAEEIKTKPINKIIVTSEPGICVYLEGNIFSTIAGGGKKVLEIGLPVLYNLNITEFKAILSHEYGHFSHRDTQWGVFTFSMGTSLINSLRAMPGPKKGSGWSIIRIIMFINPAYWIFLLYTMLYFKVTSGFSRIREVMADSEAINLYGGKYFASGLMKVATNGMVYSEVIQPLWVSALLEHNLTIAYFSKSMEHFYSKMENKELEELKTKILSMRQTHDIYDSHPALKIRIDYAMKFKDREVDIKQPVELSNARVDLNKILYDTKIDESPISELFNDWDGINEKAAELVNRRLPHMKMAMPK